jgi:polysaccharide biosynthesis protein PelA
MMNRGYATLPQVAESIDMILAEDMMTAYDFQNKKYILLPESQVEENWATIGAAQKINPKLGVYSLDYWDPDDPEQIKKIYSQMREVGYVPYVATIKLDKIIPEPK